MNLATARDELAAGIQAGGLDLTGYARPPGKVAKFPAAVVRDPARIQYHTARGVRIEVDVPVFVIVARKAAQDATVLLDELVSNTAVPDLITGLTGSWDTIVAREMDGGYLDFVQGGELVGVGAVINTYLTFKE